ncbi:MAG: HAMP domain-containing histidine kinase [Firmicutes bacterium]|nr:HAMP domain-containing histidine kinase [Bacillota bacterium]
MNSKVNFDFKSIRFRLWLYFLSTALVILALIWFLQIFFLTHYYEDMKTKEVTRVADTISMAYQHGDQGITSTIQQLSILNDYYFMMESNGKVLLFSPDAESTKPVYTYQVMLPELRDAIANDPDRDSVSIKFATGREDYNTLAYAKLIDSAKDGEVYLYVFTPLYPVSSTVDILKDQFILVSVMALVIAFVLAILYSRRISRPIKAMTESARKLGAGNYNVNFSAKSYSEINELADTLNTAAYEMEQADIRQKDLVANVSHDLKTPLTLIKSYAEMIRDLSGNNPEKRNAHLGVIIDEADRMSNLVSDMSTVSLMSRHETTLELDHFDLVPVAAEILTSYDIYVEQQGYDFRFNAPKEAIVYADRDRISQVIANLTSNSIKYCGEDKVVILNIRRTGKKYRVEVSDHGPGIKQEELPHVWDRYYKTSSNYVRATTGSGLGLSIVKEILTLHKADYGVVSKEGKGTTFWFELDMVKK